MFMVKKTGILKYMESIMKLYSLYILKNADQDIVLTLVHQKDRHIQHVRIWCFERNTVWLKEGLILVWKEDCTSSERKHCMFRGILYFWSGYCFLNEVILCLKGQLQLMNEGDFFQACKGTLQFKTDCFLQEMMCFLTWVWAHLFWK